MKRNTQQSEAPLVKNSFDINRDESIKLNTNTFSFEDREEHTQNFGADNGQLRPHYLETDLDEVQYSPVSVRSNTQLTTDMAGTGHRRSTDSVDYEANRQQSEDVPKKRKWEVFPGRNKFHCDGRIIMARQTGILWFTVGLIVVTMGCFFAFECRLSLVRLYGWYIPAVALFLGFFVMSCLLRTAWSDPGIIPRATLGEATYTEKMLQEQMAKEAAAAGQQGYRPPPRTLDVVINGVPSKLKYCFTCKIFRPPRATHCSLCDNCVECFDHHCPWVGNCVGRRNYRFFYMFVSSLSVLCVYIFAFVILHLVIYSQEQGNFWNAIKNSPGSVVEVIVCFFSVWSVVGLAGFHSYLIGLNITTNEDIKGTWSKKRNKDVINPFDRGGCLGNFAYVLCGPIPPSGIDRRGYVEELDEEEEVATSSNGLNGRTQYGGTTAANVQDQIGHNNDYPTDGASYPRQPQYPQYPQPNYGPEYTKRVVGRQHHGDGIVASSSSNSTQQNSLEYTQSPFNVQSDNKPLVNGSNGSKPAHIGNGISNPMQLNGKNHPKPPTSPVNASAV